MKKAFTMVELIFAIVVIGILASVAVPRLAATRDDAEIAKAVATVAALRSSIATEKQKRALAGEFSALTGAEATNLLDYGLGNDWRVVGNRFVFTGPSGDTCGFLLDNNRLLKENNCSMSGMGDL
jgi:general secretion pathway protein G